VKIPGNAIDRAKALRRRLGGGLDRINRIRRAAVNRRFGIAVVVYAALMALVEAVFTDCHHPPGTYIAATTLARNHRIAAGDLRRPFEWPSSMGWYLPDRTSMEGKYVVGNLIGACEPVSESSVRSGPDLHPDPELTLVSLPLTAESQLARMLDAGSTVEIQSAQKPPPQQSEPNATPDAGKVNPPQNPAGGPPPSPITASVHAILCDAPTGQDKTTTPCYAILAVPASIEQYIAAQKESIRLLPKTIPARDVCEERTSDAPTNLAKDHRTKKNP